MDEADIQGGARWWREITNAIQDCSAMIVLMTPEAEQSIWVGKEILLAQEKEKKVFPLLLRGKRFDFFVDVQFTDVSNGELPSDKFYAGLPVEAKNIVGSEIGKLRQETSRQANVYSELVQRWRVIKSEETEGRKGLLLGDAGQITSAGAWEIQTPDPLGRGVFGPYISLEPNRYRVTFRLKIDDISGENDRLAQLDVTTRMADVTLQLKTLIVGEFTSKDTYQDFHLEFSLFKPEESIEFRVRTWPLYEARKRLTVDYVELRSLPIHEAEEPISNLGIGQFLTVGELRLNSDAHKLYVADNAIQLTSTEHRIIRYFMQHPDRILSSSELLQAIWEYPPNTGDPNLVLAHLRNIAAKLNHYGRTGKEYIQSVGGNNWIFSVSD